MVTVIWGAEAVVIITVGAEVAGITMDGHAAGIAAGAKSNPVICGGRPGGDHRIAKSRVAMTVGATVSAPIIVFSIGCRF
jgi:hypothetical protein